MAPSTTRVQYKTYTFSPYRKGMGPTFRLRVWFVGKDPRSTTMVPRNLVGYELLQSDPLPGGGKDTLLFRGDDYSPSPMAKWDSKESLAGLMGFLTLKPGDTDSEYFRKYTLDQMRFARQHAESVSMAAIDKFGEY
jgi:hypothetical protein